MKISLSYIKQFLDFDLPSDTDEIVTRIGAQLGAVDDVVLDLSPIYKAIVVVKIVDCQPISGSDHLNLCKIDDGQKVPDVERDHDGLVQVVCGAPNVAAGQMVAWLPPGTIVPSTANKEPLTLTARSILDHTSNGMLASPQELMIGDSHEGLLVIDKDCNPGDSLSKLYDLDDHIVDIENKMFTHRPDCFGLVGVAREIAGIFNQSFKSPEWYLNQEVPAVETELEPITVVNEIPELVPRFSAIAIANIEIKPSPITIQSYLSRMGIRPINNIVDATNLTMLKTGQPLHAYDYDKLKALNGGKVEITVRFPRPEESITLLNSKTLKPRPESIMIATSDQLIGLAGIMGSEVAEVDDNTKAIVLESANFDMYSIRRSSMELGIFSDAVTRFSKGQSPLQTKRVLVSCLNLIKELSPGASVGSEVTDINNVAEATLARDSLHPDVIVDTDYINSRLGSSLDAQSMAKLLTNVECQVEVQGEQLSVRAPFWRTDIEIREDIVEEIGRLHGYDNLKPQLLTRPVEPVAKNQVLELKKRLRETLARAGANELLNYSFISRRLLENANQSTDVAFEIANSLSPELNFYRLSLSPSLISKVHPNIKAGYDRFALFEIGTYHQVGKFDDKETDLPKEFQSVGLVYSSKRPEAGAAYYKAKNYLDFLLSEFGLQGFSYVPLDKADTISDHLAQVVKPFNPARSALLIDSEGKQLGVVGEYLSSVQTSFKLPRYSAGFEVDSQLFGKSDEVTSYSRLSRYPSLKQDITLKLPSKLAYADLYNGLVSKLNGLKADSSFYSLIPTSIFKSDQDSQYKNYSFRLTIGDYDRTLSDTLVNKLLDDLTVAAKQQFEAERV